eukprot:GHVU01196217.1.p1 GENE.GHVU01196217.1~~GHVU01196217.1.p1  ORF type:complete len:145 (-),score=1.46 GHVU01196217.1:429-863(-)
MVCIIVGCTAVTYVCVRAFACVSARARAHCVWIRKCVRDRGNGKLVDDYVGRATERGDWRAATPSDGTTCGRSQHTHGNGFVVVLPRAHVHTCTLGHTKQTRMGPYLRMHPPTRTHPRMRTHAHSLTHAHSRMPPMHTHTSGQT